jgi:hypothetical protein
MVIVPETDAPNDGVSMCTVGGPVIWNVTVHELDKGVPSVSVAVAVRMCVPALKPVVFKENVKPTFGQPGRPGQAEQTSGRGVPYVAVPIATPSSFICTLEIAVPTAVVLSMAHPATVTVPEMISPGEGTSMKTLGGVSITVIETPAKPISDVPSLSVADTVIMWLPAVRDSVFSENVYPTLGHPGRPG